MSLSCTVQVPLCGHVAKAVRPRQAGRRCPPTITCRAGQRSCGEPASEQVPLKHSQLALAGLAASMVLLTAQQCFARPILPPIDPDPNRCERAFVGNTIGQANAVANKILDLRKCDYAGKDLSKKVLSGALLEGSNLNNTNLIEAVLTKAFAENANFEGADLTNAVVDRVDFKKANLTRAKFKNTIVTGSVFDGATLDGVIFEDALIGREDVKKLCLNPSLTGEARQDVGCRN